jgi:dienelactone hydrolase
MEEGMPRLAATLLLLMALCRGAVATEQIIVPVDYQGRQIQLTGRLDKPAGAGPYPVVIALHSCSGFSANIYGGSLPIGVSFLQEQEQGYATFKLDSFTARGLSEVCGGGFSTRSRAPDVLAAAIVLAGRPDISAERIAAIGFSHGGSTAIAAAGDFPELRQLRQNLAARGGKLAASVALYGGCGSNPDIAPVVVPLLALNGGLDDWSLPGPCTALAGMPANRLMVLHIYPDAYHHFDAPTGRGASSYSYGHRLVYNAADTADARQRVVGFLDQYLRH